MSSLNLSDLSVEPQAANAVESSSGSPTEEPSFPDGGLRAWLVVVGAFIITAITFGLQSSIGIFQLYWQTHQLSAYSPSAIGWISSVSVFWNLFLEFLVGPCFDRFGTRWLMVLGGIAYLGSIFLLIRCATYWHFLLDFGFLMGISTAFLTMPAISVLSHWFRTRLGLATGIAFTGSSIGGIAFPILLQKLLSRYGWFWAILVVGLIVSVLLVLGVSLIKGRLPTSDGHVKVNLKAFKNPSFSCATIGVACFEFTLYGVLGLLPTWAAYEGLGMQTSFNIIAVLNAGSTMGRLLSGHLSDRYGPFNTLLVTILLSVLSTLAFWLPMTTIHDQHRISTILLYLFASIFGFASGGIVSLAPVCCGSFCDPGEYGQFYGTMYMGISFTTLVCLPLGGVILSSSRIAVVAFFAAVLVVGFACFLVGRWASLGYRWKWLVII